MPAKNQRYFMVALIFSLAGGVAGCSGNYGNIRPGELSGKLIVQWLEPDVFLFTPDVTSPLTFTRWNDTEIVAGRMLTDGGSVPRPMWAFRSYSPWGYAPAFIIHDWLFHMKQCRLEGYEKYSFQESADILAEIMKTMMETGKVERAPKTLELMHAAVLTSFAEDAWTKGRCIIPPEAFVQAPMYEYAIDFDEIQ